jgi:hypothetical protein
MSDAVDGLRRGNTGDEMDASSGLACDFQGSALARGTLAHGFEAEVSREVVLRVEARAVVGDLERDAAGVLL